jgi:glycolate oxidase FAD binding subunit
MVVTPGSVDDCARALRRAAADRLRVGFLGGGTAQALGRRPEVDVTVHTEKLARIVEYAPSDMVIVVEAGVTLAALQAAAREHRQMLALDPPSPERATLGGIVASGAFGPRRARYGGVRDVIIGVTLVRADGAVARGGGKVVKNVAGFDLPKVAVGSMGTLAMIATASFRLHPLPEASQTVCVRGLDAGGVVALVATLVRAQLEPTSVVALRAEDGGFEVGVRFEGFEPGVVRQAARLGELAACAPALDDFWSRHDAVRAGGPLRVKVASMPTRLPAVAALVAPLGGRFAWYATLGLGFVSCDSQDAAAVAAAREALVASGGSLVIETAEPPLRGAVDPWGPPPPGFDLMRALKQRFDPDRRLEPGRFVGGL